MSIDERVQHLLRAAHRAEREGNDRVARSLRRMAADFRPDPWTVAGPGDAAVG